MKSTARYLFTLSTCILLSNCSKYKYWDISKFNFNNNALVDNEEVKIIYTSNCPDSNDDLAYYIHLIAVSQKTGDTVNILTTANNGLKIADSSKVFNFFNQDNIITKLSQKNIESFKENMDLKKIENTPLKKINKVARDPKFDYLADNNYPTIIGCIGINTK